MNIELLRELRGFYQLRLEAEKTDGQQSRIIAKELAKVCEQIASKTELALTEKTTQ